MSKSDKEKTDIEFLRQLQEHRGWQLVQTYLRENLDWLTERILDEADDSLREEIPKMTRRELYIKWRGYNKKLLEAPQNIIDSIESGESISQPTEFDPYPREKDIK